MKLKTPTPQELLTWQWQNFEPYFQDLLAVDLNESTVASWVAEWTDIAAAADELFNRLYVATSVNTVDEAAEQRLKDFMEQTYPSVMEKSQQLKENCWPAILPRLVLGSPCATCVPRRLSFRKENIPSGIESAQRGIG